MHDYILAFVGATLVGGVKPGTTVCFALPAFLARYQTTTCQCFELWYLPAVPVLNSAPGDL
jgi:hypothetical protein